MSTEPTLLRRAQVGDPAAGGGGLTRATPWRTQARVVAQFESSRVELTLLAQADRDYGRRRISPPS